MSDWDKINYPERVSLFPDFNQYWKDMNFKTIMFDLDGTLTDSMPGIEKCFKHALDTLNFDYTGIHEWRWIAGPPLKDSFSKLLAPEDVERAIALYRERFSSVGWMENSLYPGITALLDRLQTKGKKLYIVSSKPEIFVRKIADYFNISKYFTAIHGAALHGGLQHKPELIAYALASHNLEKAYTVMIGDRKMDIEGAKANNITSIGTAYGYGCYQELKNAGADAIANSVDELSVLLS